MTERFTPITATRAVITLPYCPEPGCGGGGERVPALHVSGDTYRIDGVPGATTLVGYGDLVIALEAEGWLEYITVIERRCLASIGFRAPDRVAETVILSELEAIGARTADLGAGLHVCNLLSLEAEAAAIDILEREHAPGMHCDHLTGAWTHIHA